MHGQLLTMSVRANYRDSTRKTVPRDCFDSHARNFGAKRPPSAEALADEQLAKFTRKRNEHLCAECFLLHTSDVCPECE